MVSMSTPSSGKTLSLCDLPASLPPGRGFGASSGVGAGQKWPQCRKTHTRLVARPRTSHRILSQNGQHLQAGQLLAQRKPQQIGSALREHPPFVPGSHLLTVVGLVGRATPTGGGEGSSD